MWAFWNGRKLNDDSSLSDNPKDQQLAALKSPHGQLVAFFVRHRAEHYVAQGVTDKDQIAAKIGPEYDAVRTFHTDVVGWNDGPVKPLVKSSDRQPAHLNLADAAEFWDPPGGASSPTAGQVSQAASLRWAQAMTIVWRAAALEPDLFTASGLDKAALSEVLDRRLHVAERMNWTVNAGSDPANLVPDRRNASHLVARAVDPEWNPTEVAANPGGPWHDRMRRAFEYPEFYDDPPLDTIVASMTAPNAPWVRMADGGVRWRLDNGSRLRPSVQPPQAGTPFFNAPAPDGYPWQIRKQNGFAAVLDEFFVSSTNVWDRSWIYCDHVISLLHLEGLLFAKRRAAPNGQGGFDAEFASHADGWTALRPLLPGPPNDAGHPGGSLMVDDDQHFVSEAVADVQIGDHVVIWNSILYPMMSVGAWSLENAIVVDVRYTRWDSNDVDQGMLLAGHGAAAQSVADYRRLLAGSKGLTGILRDARNVVRGAGAATFVLRADRARSPFVRWAPFGETWRQVEDEKGRSITPVQQDPWWVRIPYRANPGDYRALPRDETLRSLPDSIEPAADLQPVPVPDANSPATNCAYFPLFRPTSNEGWRGYLARRRAGGPPPSTFNLAPVKFDESNIPGLSVPAEFFPGQTRPRVYAVRPRVRPKS